MIVQGIVQGVYYRKSIQSNALKMNIKGYVKNLSNGDVEVGASLDNDEYEAFIQMLHKGSSYSKVNKILVHPSSETFQDFSIRY